MKIKDLTFEHTGKWFKIKNLSASDRNKNKAWIKELLKDEYQLISVKGYFFRDRQGVVTAFSGKSEVKLILNLKPS